MLLFCISSRSWNAINLKRLRKETWKIHRTRGKCWKHSSAVRELQADAWQLPLPTQAELFQSLWSLLGVGDRVLPIASTLQRLHFPQCYRQCSSGQAASVAQTTRVKVPLGGRHSAETGSTAQGWAGPWLCSRRKPQCCCTATLRPSLKCSG